MCLPSTAGSLTAFCLKDFSCPTALNHDSARTGSPRITVYTSTHFDCVPVPALLPPGTATPPAPPEGTTTNKEPVAGPGGVQPWPVCKVTFHMHLKAAYDATTAAAKLSDAVLQLQKKANKNRPSQYVWLQEVLLALPAVQKVIQGAKLRPLERFAETARIPWGPRLRMVQTQHLYL